jgi:hypothetical protein
VRESKNEHTIYLKALIKDAEINKRRKRIFLKKGSAYPAQTVTLGKPHPRSHDEFEKSQKDGGSVLKFPSS